MEQFKVEIPTREEQDRYIRRLWKMCAVLASLVFLLAGSAFFGVLLSGKPAGEVVDISTGIFQLIVLSYGLAFFVPAFLTSLYRLGLGIEMSRVGLEVGMETANVLREVRGEGMKLVEEARDLVREGKDILRDASAGGELRERIDTVLERIDGAAKGFKAVGEKMEKAAQFITSPVKLRVPKNGSRCKTCGYEHEKGGDCSPETPLEHAASSMQEEREREKRQREQG